MSCRCGLSGAPRRRRWRRPPPPRGALNRFHRFALRHTGRRAPRGSRPSQGNINRWRFNNYCNNHGVYYRPTPNTITTTMWRITSTRTTKASMRFATDTKWRVRTVCWSRTTRPSAWSTTRPTRSRDSLPKCRTRSIMNRWMILLGYCC